MMRGVVLVVALSVWVTLAAACGMSDGSPSADGDLSCPDGLELSTILELAEGSEVPTAERAAEVGMRAGGFADLDLELSPVAGEPNSFVASDQAGRPHVLVRVSEVEDGFLPGQLSSCGDPSHVREQMSSIDQ